MVAELHKALQRPAAVQAAYAAVAADVSSSPEDIAAGIEQQSELSLEQLAAQIDSLAQRKLAVQRTSTAQVLQMLLLLLLPNHDSSNVLSTVRTVILDQCCATACQC